MKKNIITILLAVAAWDDRGQVPDIFRDYASLQQLLVLANMESYNALLIEQKHPQGERLIALRSDAQSGPMSALQRRGVTRR